MSVMNILPRKLRRFARSEAGGMTVLGLFLTMGVLIIGGIAIDSSRLQARTTLMQVTADSAAYAAAQSRVFNSTTVATNAALNNARANMPPQFYGNAVTAADVQWGSWNSTTRTFTPAVGTALNTAMAVRVTVQQSRNRQNPFYNILLGWVGVPVAEPTRVAVVVNSTDRGCLREGFIAQQTLDIQSGNEFYNGFCMHSNQLIKISSGGYFESGTRVTVPDPRETGVGGDLQLPSSGLSSNQGLAQAIGADEYPLHILGTMARVITSLRDSPSTSPFVPSYIPARNRTPLPLNNVSNVDSNNLRAGNIYTANCSGSERLRIKGGAVITNVVLITNCAVDFGNDAVWESSLLATTNTDADRSIVGSQGMRIGVADGCDNGGGSQFLTMGGVSFPSGMTVYGGQIIAQKNVGFTASGAGVKGISIVAGGTISGTSNMRMSSCRGSGMDGNIMVPYTELVL